MLCVQSVSSQHLQIDQMTVHVHLKLCNTECKYQLYRKSCK